MAQIAKRGARLPLLLTAFGVVWLVAGLTVGPAVIERAYRGEGITFLEGIFAGHPAQPLEFFLGEWRSIVILGGLACFVLAGFAVLLRTPSAARRIVGKARPGTLGAIRVLVCGTLLISTLWEDLSSTAYLPREMIRPMGVMHLLYLLPVGFDRFAASPLALSVLQWGTAAALFLGMIGWRTRLALPLGALGYLLLAGLLRQYAWFYHTGLLALYLLVVLCLLPARDGWSADRLLRLWRGQPVPAADRPTWRYGWARYALWTTLALPYVAAGLSKLRNGGLFWWEADNFKHILFYSTLRPMEFDFKVSLMLSTAPDTLFEVLALSALLGELLYGLVLFSRRARWVLPTVMLGMHIGILFLQNILFFDLILLQLVFFNFRPLRKAVGRHLAQRYGRIVLAYDGASERDVRGVRVLQALDLFERLRFVDLRAGTSSSSSRALREPWRAMFGGQVYRGAARDRLLARALPALWPFLPLLHLPGASRLVRRLWTRGEAARPTTSMAPKGAAWAVGGFPSPRLVLVLTAVLLAAWVCRVEFYPVTGMQMFSKKRGSPVTYEIPLAHYRSGAVGRAPIEQSIGAMADSRYRRVLEMAFDPAREPLTEKFTRAFADRWNRKAPPEQQIVKVEVQRWQWDFVNAPDDPRHGRLIARKVYPVSPVARPASAH